jgi:hypothetical protein
VAILAFRPLWSPTVVEWSKLTDDIVEAGREGCFYRIYPIIGIDILSCNLFLRDGVGGCEAMLK